VRGSTEAGEALRGIEGGELFQEWGRFRAGPGEDSIDQAEDRWKCLSSVQLEKPTSHFSANGALG
jgi:hypothetical protein